MLECTELYVGNRWFGSCRAMSKTQISEMLGAKMAPWDSLKGDGRRERGGRGWYGALLSIEGPAKQGLLICSRPLREAKVRGPQSILAGSHRRVVHRVGVTDTYASTTINGGDYSACHRRYAEYTPLLPSTVKCVG